MSWKIILGLLLGAGLGALLGSTRSCETGACPLTATPLRGALYGAFVGLLFGLSLASGPAGENSRPDAEGEALNTAAEQKTIPSEGAGHADSAGDTEQGTHKDSDPQW